MSALKKKIESHTHTKRNQKDLANTHTHTHILQIYDNNKKN